MIKTSKIKDKLSKKIFKIEKMDVLIFLIPFIAFGISLLAFFPGLVTSDCVDQINQAKINYYSPAHPIIHSFIIGNLTKLGGIWVPALFQIIIFSFIWTYMCKHLRKYNKTVLNNVLQIVFTFIICSLPLNYLYSITLWKDIIYSYAVLLLIVLVFIGIKENYKYTNFQIFLISLSATSVMYFRHNGFPIGLSMFGIILLLSVIKNKNLKTVLKFFVTFCLMVIIMNIPKWNVNQVPSNGKGSVFNSTKIYCIGKLLNENIEFEEDEAEFLNKILDLQTWKEGYNPYTGTPILFSEKLDHSVLQDEDNEKRFNEIFFKYAKQNKDLIIKHFMDVNSIWWSVEEKGMLNTVLLWNSSVSEMSNGVYENKPILTQINKDKAKQTVYSLENKNLYEMIYRPATALYISIIILICLAIKEKKIGYILISFPMLMNIGTYILLISSQDLRYFYPNFMTEYFCVLLFINEFIKNNKMKKKNNLKINEKAPKTLVIVPAFNEEKSIKKVINDIYNQKIENCDVIVINDGSKDNTCIEAKKTNAIVIDLPNNLGIGGAVQTGYLYAKKNNYDIAIQIDGDGQHNPKYIKNLIESIKAGNDLVIGSRFVKKTSYNQTFGRMFGIKVISTIIKIMTGKKIYDVTSGFRAVNKNIIEEFTESYPYDYPEPCTNMVILKKEYKMTEIPVEMKKRENGTSSISNFKSVVYMLKVTIFLIIKGLID